MLRSIAVILFIVLPKLYIAQTVILSGKITDQQEALPFATVLVKGTTYNTISNINGDYSLKLPAGNYEIVFQYIGYAARIEKVTLSKNTSLHVTLSPDGISLKEVEIRAGEDPAYPIMREVIKKRKYYLRQPETYSCQAYIKGLQRINEIPKNIKSLIKLAGGDLSDTADIKGVVYLSESVSEYYFQQPGTIKEVMLGSKVSGDKNSFSFNKLGDMKMNFYNNSIPMGNLSSRAFISPLNENAFLFYRYYLLGTITGDGKIIYKIKVVPKRSADPCYSGILYIQNISWRITGIDFTVTKANKINFLDTLHIRQIYAPVLEDSVWMPISISLAFDLKVFGFKGTGYANASISNYNLNPVFPANFFRNEVLKIEENAGKKDSAYWENVRSTPLTQEEINDYREKDSISAIRSSTRYIDSADRQHNQLKLRHVLLGYQYNKTRKKFSMTFPGIITNGIQYNTVEGLNLSYKFGLTKTYENLKNYNISGRVRYGFSNKLWGGEAGFNYYYNPKKFSNFGFRVKSIAEQYNQQEPILPLINSAYSLLMNENYMKLYRETGLEGNYFSELSNGIFFSSSLKYLQRDPLRNSSYLLLIDDRSKLFSSNDPLNPYSDDSLFAGNRAFISEFTVIFRFKQRYYSLPDQKILAGSKYPRLSLSYKKAIPIFNTSANYDLLSAAVSDKIRMGFFGNLSYRIKGGAFLNANKLYFVDFKHFLGNQTIFKTNDYPGSFHLLPYYAFSADQWYTEAHAEHHFQGLIFNQIPGIKKLKVEEVIGFHFLSSNRLSYYYEVNFGLEKIFRVIRLDYVLGFSPEKKLKQGFTLGIDISF